MSDEAKSDIPIPLSDSTTITIVGTSNFVAPADSRELRSYEVMSYTAPSENVGPSDPLDESAIRIGNSLLNAQVPEEAFLRDDPEDI